MRVRQMVFLVGGRGSRLGALAADTPKPLLPVAPGLRFLDILLEQAARHGFTDIVLLAGHLGEQVQALYHDRRIRGATVTVLREGAPAGTGGALLQAADRLDPWFVLSNGDSYFDFNLRALAVAPEDTGVRGRMALRRVCDVSRYGAVETAAGRITAFREKSRQDSDAGLINGGVYLLSRKVLSRLSSPSSLESDLFPALAAERALLGLQRNGYFIDIGLPGSLAEARRELPARLARPAAFLDRDNVLNVDRGYTHRVEDLEWMPGARESVLQLNEAGYFVFVVTNQSGVARGLYGEAQVALFHERMQADLAEVGAHVDAFFHCPFHEDAAVDLYRAADHPDRKPNSGMILKALRDWPVDAGPSFLIGDHDSDLQAARGASLPGFLFDGVDLRATTTAALQTAG